jgi:hypothetical protein
MQAMSVVADILVNSGRQGVVALGIIPVITWGLAR